MVWADDFVTIQGAPAMRKALQETSLTLKDDTKLGTISFAVAEQIRTYMLVRHLSGQLLKVRTGRLRGGFNTVNAPNKRDAVMGTTVIYAPVHEFGSKPGARAKQRARKYMERAVQKSQKQQLRALERQLAIIMKGKK